MAKQNYATEAKLIGPFTISFPSLFTLTEMGKKYEADMLYEQGDQVHNQLQGLEKEAIKNRWGSNPPTGWLSTIKKGDSKEKVPDGYKGKLFSKLKTSRMPAVTGPDNQPISDPMEIKGGDICVAMVSAFPYDNKEDGLPYNKKGIYLTLHGVRKIREGERLGGKDVDTSALGEYDADIGEGDF